MTDTALHTKVRIPKGIDISAPEHPGSVVKECACTNTAQTSWCYLFIHHTRVDAFTERLERDNVNYFIHKTVIYQRGRQSRGVRSIERPTVSGLVFMQGSPADLQSYLDANFSRYHLVHNCSTHLPAVIPDSVMRPFMRVLETSPERIRFLLRPFRHYAAGNIKLRLTSGFLAGLEGYVIRIDRDRRLVMDVGGMSVAISGVHCEKFEVVEEEVDKYQQAKNGIISEMPSPLARNLTVLQERIARDLYIPSSQHEVSLIADILDLWRERASMYLEKCHALEAIEILFFLLEEIDSHYSSMFVSKVLDMTPVRSVIRLIADEIEQMAVNSKLTEDIRQEVAAERDSCLPRFGYLFV